jgi:hypothetical protein
LFVFMRIMEVSFLFIRRFIIFITILLCGYTTTILRNLEIRTKTFKSSNGSNILLKLWLMICAYLKALQVSFRYSQAIKVHCMYQINFGVH